MAQSTHPTHRYAYLAQTENHCPNVVVLLLETILLGNRVDFIHKALLDDFIDLTFDVVEF